MKRLAALALFVVVYCFVFTQPAHAQNGKIVGKVTDSTGGSLPGATVVSTQVDTGIHTTLVTNAAGVYVFPSLPFPPVTISSP